MIFLQLSIQSIIIDSSIVIEANDITLLNSNDNKLRIKLKSDKKA